MPPASSTEPTQSIALEWNNCVSVGDIKLETEKSDVMPDIYIAHNAAEELSVKSLSGRF